MCLNKEAPQPSQVDMFKKSSQQVNYLIVQPLLILHVLTLILAFTIKKR